jgi:hypothetical protein
MQNVVLITKENAECVVGVSVYLCNTLDEAMHFCQFANRLELASGEKYCARRVRANKEYALQKAKQFAYEDIINLNDRFIQKILREIDCSMLALALSESSDAIKDKIFRNMSKRASLMLQEDICFGGPRDAEDIALAKQRIVEVYSLVEIEQDKEISFGNSISNYSRELDDKKEKDDDKFSRSDINMSIIGNTDYQQERPSFILVFSGHDTDDPFSQSENIAVYLFETEKAASSFRDFINKMKTPKGTFYYAQIGEQMIEYEITRPLCTHFDQILDFDEYVLSLALLRIKEDDILAAIRICDTHKRERIINALPIGEADAIREQLEALKKENLCQFSIWETKRAQMKIVNAMVAVGKKMRRERYRDYPMVLKD